MEENWHRQDVKGALRAEASKSGHCVVESVSAFMGGMGAKARSIAYCDDGTTPTLKAVPSGGRPDQQHIPTVVYDARGNGDGDTAPTMTGHHNANISDYTAVVVERNDE